VQYCDEVDLDARVFAFDYLRTYFNLLLIICVDIFLFSSMPFTLATFEAHLIDLAVTGMNCSRASHSGKKYVADLEARPPKEACFVVFTTTSHFFNIVTSD
jgi:hypothetical protein